MVCFKEGYVPMGTEISLWKIRSFIQGDPACWLGVVDHSACCNPGHGSEGNAICWGASFSFKQCCVPWQQIKKINERKQPSWRNFVEATMWGMILGCGYSVPLLVPKVRRSYLDPRLNCIPFFEGCFYIHFLTKFQTNEKQNRKQISAPVLMHGTCVMLAKRNESRTSLTDEVVGFRRLTHASMNFSHINQVVLILHQVHLWFKKHWRL